MDFELILVEVTDGLAVLTLNQPAIHNGLDEHVCLEIMTALDQLILRDDVRALILTGAGKSFCAGAKLGDPAKLAGSDASFGQRGAQMMEERYNAVVLALQRFPFPIVAALNGAAAGAGISLALAADIVLAARSAYLLAPFLPRLGLVPDMGATWYLPQHVGRARAMGLMLLGDRLPAEKAVDWGLIWSCVDDEALMHEARSIAHRLAKAPAHSALESRRALDTAAEQSLAAQLDYEKERQRELLDLPSFQEGLQAFLEKREPIFKR
ncbi:enoyl-CoA hydratase-related protein [Noviherbaspirillum saxi]|uniref:Enoyl-CoA hydratase n=1 Tax=Noviherbaspirillum saxi TaxID=2320863 RepID=A0A3A3FJR8_9BURK|nr:enoyl-CoA hydratase-related protein [Noviherbaspirillum saxi]RJF95758.1 enoyl-CoA hydratase [Noviherbaspirillum saxi]